MYTLKTLILVLIVIIFSVTELRAEEISLKQLRQLNEEGEQSFNIADYPTALKKFEQGLNLSYQTKN